MQNSFFGYFLIGNLNLFVRYYLEFSDSYLLMRAPLDSLIDIFNLTSCENKPFFPVCLLLLTSQPFFIVSV